jgi:DNA-binding NarL/FixJ family response regulator
VALEQAVAATRITLGDAAFQAAWDAGRILGPDQAVAAAQEAVVFLPGAPHGSLTPREMEILRLIAAGKSNPDIAGDLYLSVRTVENHVAHILAKLDVRTRNAAVIAAGLSSNPLPPKG